jgi:dephospho-CoA kinase
MTKIIGLTGGIGSGKTTVANLFRQHGVPVYIADDQAKKILNLPETVESIAQTFGALVISGGKVNREALANIVFENPEKLRLLNNIIHPAVRKDFLDWVKEHESHPIIIKEAAILFESGNDLDCDAIITVTAPLETRIERVMKRDKTSRESVLKRIENQWTDDMRIAKSDYVIENISPAETGRQVSKTLKKLQIF